MRTKSLGQKLSEWLCKKFGHQPNVDPMYTRYEATVSYCDRCGYVVQRDAMGAVWHKPVDKDTKSS